MGRVTESGAADARTGVTVGGLAREVMRQALRDDIVGLSAELAYRFFLALFPFFVFLTAFGVLLAETFGIANPAQLAVDVVGEILPRQGSQFIEGQLDQIVEGAGRRELIGGGLLAIVIATSGTNAIIKGLNRAYGVKEHRPMWKRYLIALMITVAAGTSTVLALLLFIPLRLSAETLAGHAGAAGAAIALLVVAVTLLFRIGPSIKLPLRVVLPGAVTFAVLWVVAATLFGIYISEFADYASTYGVIAGVAIVMIWFYLLGFILLLAAESNQVIHETSDPADMARRREQAAAEGQAEFRPTRDLPRALDADRDVEGGAAG